MTPGRRTERPELAGPVPGRSRPWIGVFLGFLLPGIDFWASGRTPVFLAGLPPLRVWCCGILGVLLAVAYRVFLARVPEEQEWNRSLRSQRKG